MPVLLDTHIFLWLTTDDPRLTPQSKALMEEADKVLISAASIWEIAIKARIGKLTGDPDALIAEIDKNSFEELPVFARHAREVAKLPMLHADPFDRLLVGQAIAAGLQLLTADPKIKAYSKFAAIV